MRWIAVYIWAGIIFTLSSIPTPTAPKVFGIDKIAHFIVYLILGLLAFRNSKELKIILYLMLFASIDEFHQRFIPGRNMDIFDALVDFLGIFISLVITGRRTK